MDGDDHCATRSGPVANFGCPLVDSDSDGLPDPDDRCPEDPGSEELSGCPDEDDDKTLKANQALRCVGSVFATRAVVGNMDQKAIAYKAVQAFNDKTVQTRKSSLAEAKAKAEPKAKAEAKAKVEPKAAAMAHHV